MTTSDQRRHQVNQMRANFAIEGLHADPVDAVLQDQYIDGDIGIEDLLRHARDYARLAKTSKE